jgi:hypothetical protein
MVIISHLSEWGKQSMKKVDIIKIPTFSFLVKTTTYFEAICSSCFAGMT